MAKKATLTEQLLKELTELNAALAPKKDGGGAKSRRRARKVAGGSALSAFSPAVYNIQGLLSESHDPANVTRDPAIAAMTQLHAPFSAGVVSATLQSPTADIAPAAIQRITPMVGMGPPISAQAGGAKKARAAKKPRAAKKAA